MWQGYKLRGVIKMIKEFNSLEELKLYYDEKTSTYILKENDEWLDVKFNFHLNIHANIDVGNIYALDIHAGDINALDIHARNINARNIDALDIHAGDINAWNVYACDIHACDIIVDSIFACNISFLAVCVAYKNIRCTSVKAEMENNVIKALNGNIVIRERRTK